MAEAFVTNLDRDGETRRFAGHGQAVLGTAGGLTILRTVFEPGWRWSNDIKPIAGTDSCQIRHLGYVMSGRLNVRLNDGTEFEMGSGDLYDIQPGHDAWVLGDERCVMVDFSPDATRYATGMPKPTTTTEPDRYLDLVRAGYAAFNARDMDALRTLMATEVVQHVPGQSRFAGSYKGIDNVLAYYGTLGEVTGGTFRVDLIDVHGDGHGHVTAIHQVNMSRGDAHRVTRGSILFTFLGDKVTDLLEMRPDLAGDDAFFADA